MREIIYYLGSRDKPTKTSVVLLEEEGKIARGVSICSKKDNFNRKLGRAIARGRAIKAMGMERSCVNNSILRPEAQDCTPDVFDTKCEFMPRLTPYETQLIAGVNGA